MVDIKKMKELREKGYFYHQIAKELGCHTTNVCYHLGIGQKEKFHKSLKNEHPFGRKIRAFNRAKPFSRVRKELLGKIYNFHKINRKGVSVKNLNFTLDDVINKFDGENVYCYLTGDKINIYDTSSYNFDHIIPRCKGGSNTLDNLGICTKIANQSKNIMTKDEYLEHCKKVLTHNGFEVIKVNT